MRQAPTCWRNGVQNAVRCWRRWLTKRRKTELSKYSMYVKQTFKCAVWIRQQTREPKLTECSLSIVPNVYAASLSNVQLLCRIWCNGVNRMWFIYPKFLSSTTHHCCISFCETGLQQWMGSAPPQPSLLLSSVLQWHSCLSYGLVEAGLFTRIRAIVVNLLDQS